MSLNQLVLDKRSLYIFISVLIAGIVGFLNQKLIVSILAPEDFAIYDLNFAFIAIFISTLNHNFVNFYKNRYIKYQGQLFVNSPFHLYISIGNTLVVLFASFFLWSYFQLTGLSLVGLMIYAIAHLLWRFQITLVNIKNEYQAFSVLNLIPSVAYHIILWLALLLSKDYPISHAALIWGFGLAHCIFLVKVKFSFFRITWQRFKVIYKVAWPFMAPLLLYGTLVWLNDNIAKIIIYNKIENTRMLGIYAGLYGLFTKLILTGTAVFNFILEVEIYKPKLDYSKIIRLIGIFVVLATAGLGIAISLRTFIIPLFLNKEYLTLQSIILPIILSAILFQLKSFVEIWFMRFSKTNIILISFLVLVGSYVIIVFSASDITIEKLCWAQVWATLISLLTTCLFFKYYFRHLDVLENT